MIARSAYLSRRCFPRAFDLRPNQDATQSRFRVCTFALREPVCYHASPLSLGAAAATLEDGSNAEHEVRRWEAPVADTHGYFPRRAPTF